MTFTAERIARNNRARQCEHTACNETAARLARWGTRTFVTCLEHVPTRDGAPITNIPLAR